MGSAFALSLTHRRTEFALARQTEVEARLRVLVDELNHRVRNILTIVQALIRFSFRDGAHGPGRAMLRQRLNALGQAATLLAGGDWTGVSIKEFVGLSALSASRGVRVEGPELRLTPAAAQNLGLVIHELWTNATIRSALSSARLCTFTPRSRVPAPYVACVLGGFYAFPGLAGNVD
jgi:two-component sensor histidine kinase